MKLLQVAAGLLFIIAFIPYVIAIVRKKTQPKIATWVIWGSLDTITLVGMFFKDTVNGQILGAVAGVWVVVALTLKYGETGWKLLDKFCLGGAILAIALWKITGDPVFGIVSSISVVFIGSIPTFISAWKNPANEDRLAWTIFFLSCVCAVIAIPRWTLADAAQPIAFFAIELTMMFILYIRPLMLKK